MLTVKQPPTHGYKSVYDLPTPPSTSRPSPPLNYHEPSFNSVSSTHRSHSPANLPMAAPHRGLPPPAGMPFPPQQPVSVGAPPLPPAHHGPPQSLTQNLHQNPPSWTALPPPPQQWQGSEDSMRNWLQAKTEEEKTKQEEEKTRQEGLRLEQRKIEMDMLRASLGGGIPPPMVPIVFAGMASGGILPQAALEWAQQFMPHPQTQGQPPQLMPPQRPHSPEHHRENSGSGHSHGQYPAAATPGSTQGASGYSAAAYPGSPARPRGQTVSGPIGRPSLGAASNLPSLNTNAPQPGQSSIAAIPPYQPQAHPHAQSAQQDSSPSIYFHHWQPPASHGGGGSNRPGTPSGSSKNKRKRGSL